MRQLLFFFVILSTLVLSSTHSTAQNYNYDWAATFNGPNLGTANYVTTDPQGNVYVALTFSGTYDVQPGPGTTNFSSKGSYDMALIKLKADGSFIWAKQIGGSGDDQVQGIELDAAGNIYIGGWFYSTVDFDPGPSNASLSPVSGADVFAAKYDSAGNYIWSKAMGGSGHDFAYRLHVDQAGNSYLVGRFHGSNCDYDPGTGTRYLSVVHDFDGFVVKLKSNGSLDWAHSIGGQGGEVVFGVNTDSKGNVALTGWFDRTVDFDPSSTSYNMTSSSNYDMFLMQLDDKGTFKWAKQMVHTGPYFDGGYDVGLDKNDNLYFTGRFSRTTDFDGGTGTYNLTPSGNVDGFICKYSSLGNFIWAKQLKGSNEVNPWTISVGTDNNIYTTRRFKGSMDMDPGSGVKTVSSNGDWDIFLSVLDTNGNYVWGTGIGGSGYDFATTVHHSSFDNSVFLGGAYSGTVDFDPSTATANFSTKGNRDGFVLKLKRPIDSINLGPDTTLCLGDSIKLSTGLSDFVHKWNDNSSDTVLWVKDSGTYSVEVYYYGDTLRDTIHIDFDKGNHFPNLGKDTAVCLGDSVVLNTNFPNLKNYWSTGDTTSQITVPVGGPYIAFVTNDLGCTRTDTIKVNPHPLVVVDLGKDTSICLGDSVIIDAGLLGMNYQWSTNETTQKIVVKNSDKISIIVTSNEGCIGLDTVSVNVNPIPDDIDLGNDTAFCEGDNFKLETGKPAYLHLWSNNKATPTIFTTNKGLYWVEVTNSFGCKFRDSVILDFNPVPKFSLGFNRSVCEGDSVKFETKLSNTQYKHFWNTGDTTNVIWAKLDGAYIVNVTNMFGCSSMDTVSLTLNKNPRVNLGPDRNACIGTTFIIRTGLIGNNYSHSWNTGSINDSIIVDQPGKYIVEVFDNNNCFGSDSVNVVFNPKPTVYVGPDTAFCGIRSYQINAEGDSIISYQWNTGESTKYIVTEKFGEFYVKVFNKYNCSDADTINIIKNNPPIILLQPDTFFECNQAYLQVRASSSVQKYLWSTGETTPSITIFDTGWYYVESSIPFCTSKDSIYVYDLCPEPYEYPEFYIPNSFTPFTTGGLNQTFKPIVNGNITDYNLRIYNRWGEKLFDSKNPNLGWNGRANGVECQQDVYAYIFTFKYENGQEDYLSGTLTLLR